MARRHIDPAKTVIARMGGASRVSEITGRNIATVYRWMNPRERGGTDGIIPHEDARKLLECAEKNGLDLVHSDFFEARPFTEKAA